MDKLPFKKRLPGLVKGWIFSTGFYRLLHPFAGLMKWLALIAEEGVWIKQTSKNKLLINDYYTSSYSYPKRFKLYEALWIPEQLDQPIDFLEFGVAHGVTFKWWVEKNKHPDSSFFGFDTFTGLPENWGAFKKGDMSADGNYPDMSADGNYPDMGTDTRHQFFKGIFQDTLLGFLKTYDSSKKKIISLDADLFSSTIFVLTQLYPYLNVGDVLIFDEFNVPAHEYHAFRVFADSFYIDYEVLGAINNFYCVAIKLTGLHK